MHAWPIAGETSRLSDRRKIEKFIARVEKAAAKNNFVWENV